MADERADELPGLWRTNQSRLITGEENRPVTNAAGRDRLAGRPGRNRLSKLQFLTLVATVYFCAVVIGILLFAGVNWLLNLNLYLGLAVFAGCMFGTHVLTARDRKYNAEMHPQLLKRWQAAWMCLRCGKKWIPEK